LSKRNFVLFQQIYNNLMLEIIYYSWNDVFSSLIVNCYYTYICARYHISTFVKKILYSVQFGTVILFIFYSYKNISNNNILI